MRNDGCCPVYFSDQLSLQVELPVDLAQGETSLTSIRL